MKKYPLFKHQQEGLKRARCGNLCLFHDCGTGKTYTALKIIEYFWMEAKARAYRKPDDGPALVVCPITIIEDAWIADCKKFTPHLDIVSLWSKKPAERINRLNEDHDIYAVNYELLKILYYEIAAKGFKLLFVDESSKMKNYRSDITKALLSFSGVRFRKSKYKTMNIIPHRYPMSGTPAPNDESEYWAQIKLVTGIGGDCLNDNFFAFRAQFFQVIPLGTTGQKIYKFRPEMRQQFMDAISPVCHVVSKEDALDLPPQVHEIRSVKLSKPEQAAYDEMEQTFVLKFKEEAILSSNALVEVMKLRQLTSGFIYGEKNVRGLLGVKITSDKSIHYLGGSKLKELMELLEEIGNHQVIIWINFHEEGKRILAELWGKKTIASLWGNIKDRNVEIQKFKSGKAQYLIANPQSAAHGLSFQCSYAVYFSLNYSYEQMKQSRDRIHGISRGQQDISSTYYYLLAENTIDKIIYKSVLGKADLSTETLNYLKGQ